MQSANDIKDTAHKLIDTLPDDTSWEKLLHTLQIRHDIEAGLKDSEASYVSNLKTNVEKPRKITLYPN